MKRLIRFLFVVFLKLAAASAPLSLPIMIHAKWLRNIAAAAERDAPTITLLTTAGAVEIDPRESVAVFWPGETLAAAIVASEDCRFWDREGAFDPKAAAASLRGSLKGKGLRGFSSIPMQLGRIRHPFIATPEKKAKTKPKLLAAAITRKWLEIALGDRALAQRGHRAVLAHYCAIVATPGPGLESAALREFGKFGDQLSAHEANSLSALLPEPSRRTGNRTTWLEAAMRRDPHAVVPRSRAFAGTCFPLGSLLTHRDRVLDPETTRHAFLLGHRFLLRHPSIRDLGVVVLDQGQPVALVDSCQAGVRQPWPWSTIGSIRMNSTIKVFEAAEGISAGRDKGALGRALEQSDNDYFTKLAGELGEARINSCLDRCGLIDAKRSGFSALGRCWTSPLDLAQAISRCVGSSPALATLLREVPRRGTAASALATWPRMPSETYCKTGTSPMGQEFLIVGGDGRWTVLIWAKASAPSSHEAGPTIGPLFAEILRHLHTNPRPPCPPTFARFSD